MGISLSGACSLGDNCTYATSGDCSLGYECTFTCTAIAPKSCAALGCAILNALVSNRVKQQPLLPGPEMSPWLAQATTAAPEPNFTRAVAPLISVAWVPKATPAIRRLFMEEAVQQLICDGNTACDSATFNLGSGPTSLACSQQDSCQSSTINGGTGTGNLTCGAVPVGDDDPCASLKMNQNNAIISETDAQDTYHNFACQVSGNVPRLPITAMAVWRCRVLARVLMVPAIPVEMAPASPAPLAGLVCTATTATPPTMVPPTTRPWH